ncbi:hypothetical protein [Desulfovulcanus sp.]
MKSKLVLIIAVFFIVIVGFSGWKKKHNITASLENQAQMQLAKAMKEKMLVAQELGQEDQIQEQDEGQEEYQIQDEDEGQEQYQIQEEDEGQKQEEVIQNNLEEEQEEQVREN